jgi:branched-chain amino acid transport system permease protein
MFKVLIEQTTSSLVIGITYALVALGFNLIFGIMGLVHFAHFEVYMVGAFIGLMAAVYLKANLFFVFLLAMIGAGCLGIIVEKIAFYPIRKEPVETQLFSSIAIAIILQNTGLMVWGTEWTLFPELIPPKIYSLSWFQITKVQLVIFAVVILLLIGLRFVLYKTKLGISVRAVSNNRDAATLMGINTNTTISISFGFASMLAGAAGVIMGLYYHMIYPLMGATTGLKAFIAVVIGGIGSLPGSVAGGLILGLAEGLGTAFISSTWRDGIAFTIFVLVLLIKPSGLFEVRKDEKF